jgi:hypothetical protein
VTGRVELNGLMRADRKQSKALQVVSDGNFTRYKGSAHRCVRNEWMRITCYEM